MRVVALAITLPPRAAVELGPVQLDRESELFVQDVDDRPNSPHLPESAWKTVSTLDIDEVAALQRAARPRCGVSDDLQQKGSSWLSSTFRELLPDPVSGREARSDRFPDE